MFSAETGFVFAFFVFSVVVHEVMHGWTAERFGDSTARDAGRITLDPLVHIDPVMTIIVPLLMLHYVGFAFGGAKPVPVQSNRVRPYRKGNLWISAAGPGSNIVLAVAFALLTRLALALSPEASTNWDSALRVIVTALAVMVFINLYLALFNLLPIPPLDGGHITVLLLPKPWDRKLEQLEPVGFFIVVGLIWMGALRYIAVPAAITARTLLGRDGFGLAISFLSG